MTKNSSKRTAKSSNAPVIVAEQALPGWMNIEAGVEAAPATIAQATNVAGPDFFSDMAASLQADVDAQAAEALVIAELEAEEAAARPAAPVSEIEAAPVAEVIAVSIAPVYEPGDFKDIVSNIAASVTSATQTAMENQLNDRSYYERMKNPGNLNIQDSLKKFGKAISSAAAANTFVAVNISTAFINREIATGSRFNVYAIDKVNDVVTGLTAGFMKNAINLAVMRSLFKFRDAGVPFTGLMALAAASDKVSVDKAVKSLLVRHTVSASTAPTQSSSSMSALEVLGVVVNRGTKKFPTWQLTDTPQTRRLEEVLMVA